ncbi:MAG TPA: phosphotransferase [Ktedonobacterales bacterium]
MESALSYESLLSAWELSHPQRLTRWRQGSNNDVFHVETPTGDFVLRVSHNADSAGELRYEHAILAGLGALSLPFAVPTPMPTQIGEPFATVATAGSTALATLTPLIPGDPPDTRNLEQAAAAGATLAELDLALAGLALPDPDLAITWRSSGDLTRCHPLVPDPVAAIAALPLPGDACQRLLARYSWLGERTPHLYAGLPRQLLHEDADPSNFLMQGTRVTGILDFEFSAIEVRPMELTVALTWWPGSRFGTGEEWPIVAALARGYARHISLSPPEIEAIPTFFEFRAYTSLIHRLGRYRAHLSPMESVIERAHAALARADWLAANGERLKQVLYEEATL